MSDPRTSTAHTPTWADEREEAYRRARGLGVALLLVVLVAAAAVTAVIVAALR